MNVRGFGLVLAACALILRYSRKYYTKHKGNYTVEQQNMLEVLFGAASWIVDNLKAVVNP